jgi:DNA polymerase/3'-5' exonuclease PolX
MKQKFDLNLAKDKAQEIKTLLKPFCHRVEIAGSIRRKQPQVGDIEILYIPKRVEAIPKGELVCKTIDKSQERILSLIEAGVLCLRKKKNGTTSFGQRVKLLLDKDTDIPVDLFACEEQQWVNNLVSRTGGKMTNITIASHAKRLGWNWLMSDAGFINKKTSEVFIPSSEEDVFKFARIPYMNPEERP